MSPFDRDTSTHMDSPGEAPRDASATSGSNSDAENSAAHIAELVARTSQRDARPGPSSNARAQVTVEQPPMPPPSAGLREVPPVAQPDPQPVRPTTRGPSRRVLVAGVAVAVALIVGGFALSRLGSSPATDAPPTARSSVPAVYAVQVTDVITDCATHSHGRTQNLFRNQNCVKATRFLATGQVSGRPTVFVVSRIQMASADAAASVKQVLDATGTGNLNDLLREGKTFPGAPSTMPDSGYASVQTGAVVVVAEAGFVHGPSSNTSPALRAAAAQVASLVTSQS
jgi:hypothetical protein